MVLLQDASLRFAGRHPTLRCEQWVPRALEHELRPEGGGTRIRDTVYYRVPFAWLRRIGLLACVDRDLQRIFSYRQQVIARELSGGEPGLR